MYFYKSSSAGGHRKKWIVGVVSVKNTKMLQFRTEIYFICIKYPYVTFFTQLQYDYITLIYCRNNKKE